jgi:hypothetical protein
MDDFSDCGILEPWKFGKWQKQLLIINKQPEAKSGDVGYFNWGSV